MIVDKQDQTSGNPISKSNTGSLEAEKLVSSEDSRLKSVKQMTYLIADTAAFIKNTPMHEYAEHVISIKDVVDEIRDKETKQRLLACPIDIQYREPDTQAIKKVTDFSKKTGDFGSLSATDIKVLALTYMLEATHVGTKHLNDQPIIKRTVDFYKPGSDVQQQNAALTKMPGFYMPSKEEQEESENEEMDNQLRGDIDELNEERGRTRIASVDESDAIETGDVLEEDKGCDADEADDDIDGWITPNNYTRKKSQLEKQGEKPLLERVEVACMTSDFAMQNVLISMGLHVASPTGQLIRETKTWILRCYACFKTTPLIDKKFCPKCGNKTLKRVSVTLNADGTQDIHISTRKPLSKTGKKFSLPMPSGGKHSVNPILCEDQQLSKQRTTRMARAKTNALETDYVCGNAPFSQNDVNSRSAMLGVGKTSHQYWLHKNPNAVGKKTGNRKKKKI